MTKCKPCIDCTNARNAPPEQLAHTGSAPAASTQWAKSLAHYDHNAYRHHKKRLRNAVMRNLH